MAFTERDKNAVGCGNKSPKEKYNDKRRQRTSVGGLFRLSHEASIWFWMNGSAEDVEPQRVGENSTRFYLFEIFSPDNQPIDFCCYIQW